MRMRSGWYFCSTTCCRAVRKSPTREQQMQPAFSSLMRMPDCCKTAVNADLAKFVLDQHDLLSGKGLLDQL